MKILHITSRADQGGGPEHVYQLVKGLEGLGEKCFIACPNDKPYQGRFAGVVGMENMLDIPHRKFSPLAFISLLKFIRRNKFNVLHSHGKGAGTYSRLLRLVSGVKVVHTFHGFHIGEYARFSKFLYLLYERASSLLTSQFIFVSKGEAAAIVSETGVANNKANVIYNGVQISNESKLVAGRGKFSIVAVSRYDFQKNTEELIEALNILKNKGLKPGVTILGDGEGADSIKASCLEYGLDNVVLEGNVSNPRSYFQNASLFVNTSRWEGLPIAPIEAMAEGVPCVLSEVVGNAEVVSDLVDGYFYPSGNPEELANIIKDLMEDTTRLLIAGRAAKDKANTLFSVDKMVRETVKIYQALEGEK